MLSILATSLILGFTLLLFLLTVLIPVKYQIGRLFNAPDDHFISSRNTQSWISVGFSLYAGAVGTWVLTAIPETAITGGWFALLGYSVACGFPWVIYLWSGIKVRRMMQYRGFTSLEFVYERYGRLMHIIVSAMSVVYLVGMLVSELTAIGACLLAISPGFPSLATTLSIVLVTNFYSAIGGLPASMLTDKLQGILTILLVVVCYGGILGSAIKKIDSVSWSNANTWQSEGVVTGLTLIFACFIVEQLNQSTWQRVFAARTERDLYWGFVFGVALMFPSMIIFGFAGIVGKAADLSGYIHLDPLAPYEAVFLLLAKLPSVWLGMVVFMAIGLVTSTADTIQTGLAAIISGELANRELSFNWARIFSLVLNIPAVFFATFQPPSILAVMMTVNVLTIAIVPSILIGFSEKVTPFGAVIGVVVALLSILIQGFIFGKSFKEAWLWGTFPHGYNWECLVTLIVVASLSAVVPFLVAQVEFQLNPGKRQAQLDRLDEIRRRNAEAAQNCETACSMASQDLSRQKSTASQDISRLKSTASRDISSC